MGTWLVPIFVFGGLGLLFLIAGATGEVDAAPLLWIGGVMSAVPFIIVAGVMLQRCEVEVSRRGVRVLSRPRIEATWSQIAALRTITTVDADRDVLAVVLSGDAIREQMRRGRPRRPTHRVKLTKDAADAIKRLWAEDRIQHPRSVDRVDCYVESPDGAPWMFVYVVWIVCRMIVANAWSIGITLACALVLWLVLRDRRITHIEADAQGLRIIGRLGYRVAWREVESIVTVPVALTAADRVTLQLTAEAKRRIGWRRFLDGFGRVAVAVPSGVGNELVALRERSRPVAYPFTPTSDAG